MLSLTSTGSGGWSSTCATRGSGAGPKRSMRCLPGTCGKAQAGPGGALDPWGRRPRARRGDKTARQKQAGGKRMKTSKKRNLNPQVGSIPRPESIRALLGARLSGQTVDEAQLAARVAEAVAEVVRQQAEVGIDVISDGEMGKTSFLAYADTRLTGFVTLTADNPEVP